MEDNNNIDDLFRSSIEPVNTDPPEHGWSTLNDMLDRKQALLRNKKRFRVAFLFLIVLLTSLISYQVYSPSDNLLDRSIKHKSVEQQNIKQDLPAYPHGQSAKNHAVNNSVADEKIEKTSTYNPIITSTSSAVNPNSGADNSIADNRSLVKATNHHTAKRNAGLIVSAYVTAPAKTVNKDLIVEQNEIPSSAAVSSTQLVTDIAVVPEMNDTELKSDSIKENTEIKPPGFDAGVIVAGAETKAGKTKKHNNAKSVETDKQVSESIKSSEVSSVSDRSATDQDKEVEQNKANADSSMIALPFAVTATVPTVNSAEATVPFLKRVVSHLSFNAFYSPDYAQRYLKQDNSTSSSSQLVGKDQSNYSYSTGARVGYQLGGKWSVSSGCFYSTFSQSVSTNNIAVQSEKQYIEEHGGHEPGHGQGHGGAGGGHGGGHGGGGHGGGWPGGGPGGGGDDSLHYIVHTSCGTISLSNPIPGKDNEEGETININTSITQVIQFINVPLTVRFQMEKNKFGYYVNAGGAASFAIKDKVTIDFENYGSQTSSIDGLKKTSYSVLLDLGIQYKFYRQLNVFLEPNLRYSVTPINQDYSTKSYPYYLGLRVGLGIHF